MSIKIKLIIILALSMLISVLLIISNNYAINFIANSIENSTKESQPEIVMLSELKFIIESKHNEIERFFNGKSNKSEIEYLDSSIVMHLDKIVEKDMQDTEKMEEKHEGEFEESEQELMILLVQKIDEFNDFTSDIADTILNFNDNNKINELKNQYHKQYEEIIDLINQRIVDETDETIDILKEIQFQFLYKSLITIVIATFLFVLFGFYILRTIIKPINKLKNAAEGIFHNRLKVVYTFFFAKLCEKLIIKYFTQSLAKVKTQSFAKKCNLINETCLFFMYFCVFFALRLASLRDN